MKCFAYLTYGRRNYGRRRGCERQNTFGFFFYEPIMISDEADDVNCRRMLPLPTDADALTDGRDDARWQFGRLPPLTTSFTPARNMIKSCRHVNRPAGFADYVPPLGLD